VIEPQTVIDGRYRVLSRIGSGGMADVYLAEDLLLGRQLAVKVLHHHFAEDQEFVERFRREASSAAGLSHPNIVAIFDRGEWDGTYYIAMEYVPGQPLKTLVRDHGALAPAAAIDIATQILAAARFAHARGIIHRDLKPHNVILDEEGRARVTDFGIARAAVSARSDLYAVGVILYELLTGTIPFDGDTAVAIAFKQVSAEPRPPSSVNPALPPFLDQLVLRALAKDPAQRYAGADEFIAALHSARERLPESTPTTVFAAIPLAIEGQAPPPAVPPSTAQAPPEQGPRIVPPGTALSTGLAPPALLMPADGALPAQESPEEQARRRRVRWALAAACLLALTAVALALFLPGPASKVTVANVVGQSEATAATTLRAGGLVPVATYGASADVPSGVVTGQSPSAGSAIAKGSRVTIAVSSGPGSSALPDVAGLTASQATAKLKTAGFRPTTETQPSTSVASGRVIATDPPAETEVRAGASVRVLVSGGPAATDVPDLVGQTRAAAEGSLANAGLNVGAVTQQASSEQSPGTVLEQFPTVGSSLSDGGKVDLTVAQAPSEIPVPDVVGQNEAQASAALGRAGFTPKASTQTTTEASLVGLVLSQKPAAGHNARKGTTVTIAIAVLGPQTTPTTTTTTPATTPASPPPSAPTP
jgi:eukaryotic-like serine/threonine-protein kinase